MKNFKVKFFGSKKEKEPIGKQSFEVAAFSASEVETVLQSKGWKRIHGLKIREV